jgi:hypothetical protein
MFARKQLKEFVCTVNAKLEAIDSGWNEVSCERPHDVLVRRRKGDSLESTTPLECFKIKEHHVVMMDEVVSSFEKRFGTTSPLLKEIAYLDPKLFATMAKSQEAPSFPIIEAIMKKVTPETVEQYSDQNALGKQLIHFAQRFAHLKAAAASSSPHFLDKECCECLKSAHRVLFKYGYYSCAYDLLSWAYKIVLTLSVTQVACETSFSKLVHVKNKYRSSLTEAHLDVLMLLNAEQELLQSIDTCTIVEEISKHSSELHRHLSF